MPQKFHDLPDDGLAPFHDLDTGEKKDGRVSPALAKKRKVENLGAMIGSEEFDRLTPWQQQSILHTYKAAAAGTSEEMGEFLDSRLANRGKPGNLKSPLQHVVETSARSFASMAPDMLRAVKIGKDSFDRFIMEDDPTADGWTLETAEKMDRWLEENLGGNEEYAGDFLLDVIPSAFGSVAGFFVGGGGVTKGIGFVGKASNLVRGVKTVKNTQAALKHAKRARNAVDFAGTAITGAAVQSGQMLEDALDSQAYLDGTLSYNKALNASYLGGLIGTSEAIPLDFLFSKGGKRFLSSKGLGKFFPDASDTKGIKPIQARLRNAMRGGKEEAIQEALSDMGLNAVKQQFGFLDSSSIFEGLGTSAGAGFVVGSFLGGMQQGHHERKVAEYSKTNQLSSPSRNGSRLMGISAIADVESEIKVMRDAISIKDEKRKTLTPREVEFKRDLTQARGDVNALAKTYADQYGVSLVEDVAILDDLEENVDFTYIESKINTTTPLGIQKRYDAIIPSAEAWADPRKREILKAVGAAEVVVGPIDVDSMETMDDSASSENIQFAGLVDQVTKGKAPVDYRKSKVFLLNGDQVPAEYDKNQLKKVTEGSVFDSHIGKNDGDLYAVLVRGQNQPNKILITDRAQHRDRVEELTEWILSDVLGGRGTVGTSEEQTAFSVEVERYLDSLGRDLSEISKTEEADAPMAIAAKFLSNQLKQIKDTKSLSHKVEFLGKDVFSVGRYGHEDVSGSEYSKEKSRLIEPSAELASLFERMAGQSAVDFFAKGGRPVEKSSILPADRTRSPGATAPDDAMNARIAKLEKTIDSLNKKLPVEERVETVDEIITPDPVQKTDIDTSNLPVTSGQLSAFKSLFEVLEKNGHPVPPDSDIPGIVAEWKVRGGDQELLNQIDNLFDVLEKVKSTSNPFTDEKVSDDQPAPLKPITERVEELSNPLPTVEEIDQASEAIFETLTEENLYGQEEPDNYDEQQERLYAQQEPGDDVVVAEDVASNLQLVNSYRTRIESIDQELDVLREDRAAASEQGEIDTITEIMNERSAEREDLEQDIRDIQDGTDETGRPTYSLQFLRGLEGETGNVQDYLAWNNLDTFQDMVKGHTRFASFNDFTNRMKVNDWRKKVSEEDLSIATAYVEGTGITEAMLKDVRKKGGVVPMSKQEVISHVESNQSIVEVVEEYRSMAEASRLEINKYAQGLGIDEFISFYHDYVAHLYRRKGRGKLPEDAEELHTAVLEEKFSQLSRNVEARVFPSYAEAAENNYNPFTINLAELHERWTALNYRVLSHKMLWKGLPKAITENGEQVFIPIRDSKDEVPLTNYARSLGIIGGLRNSKVWVDDMARAIGFNEPDQKYTKVELPGIYPNGAYVHPDYATAVKRLSDRPTTNNHMNGLMMFNALSKNVQLSASFFHWVPLAESAMSVLGKKFIPNAEARKAAGLNRYATPWKVGVELMRNETFAKEMIGAGLTMQTPSDVFRSKVDNFLDSVGDAITEINPTAGSIHKGFMSIKKSWDAALWDHFHTGLKAYSFYSLYQDILKKNPDMDVKRANEVKQDLAALLNDAFGGQAWSENLAITPKFQQAAQLLMLAPDWTLSNFNIAFRRSRGDTLKEQYISGEGMDPVVLDVKKAYWRNMLLTQLAVAYGFQAVIKNLWGEDDEAMSQHFWENPGKFSFAEIDVTPMMRKSPLLSQLSGLNKQDVEGGQRYYMHFGKQVREVTRYFTDVGGVLKAKSSPLAHTFMEQFMGRTMSDWPLPWNDGQRGGKQHLIQSLPSRAKYMAGNFAPFSMQGVLKDTGIGSFLFTLPMKKGMTKFKAESYFVEAIRVYAEQDDFAPWDLWTKHKLKPAQYEERIEKLGSGIYLEMLDNGMDKEEVSSYFNSAKGTVSRWYYRDFMEAYQDGNSKKANKALLRLALLGRGVDNVVSSLEGKGVTLEPSDIAYLRRVLPETGTPGGYNAMIPVLRDTIAAQLE